MYIKKNEGFTISEKKLAYICEKTFLDLWSYPNTFIDRKQNGKGDGNEFCDLLVVCGNEVVIFSDKSIEWPNSGSTDLSWSRWYKRAIQKSVRQIKGAVSWLSKFPDRIYLNKECTEKLKIALPPKGKIRIHGIVVAVGANKACKDFFGYGLGTFSLRPSLKNLEHIDATSANYAPFCIGDTDTSGPFIHVFDEKSLDIIFLHFTTIDDFVGYLSKRASLIRGGKLEYASGEEDLIAKYLSHTNPDGTHDFSANYGDGKSRSHNLRIIDGIYEAFIADEKYINSIEANRISYFWDGLIKEFVGHIISGTWISLDDEKPYGLSAETALRIMASENRLSRRMLSSIYLETRQISKYISDEYACKIFFRNPDSRDRGTIYFFLFMKYTDGRISFENYNEYRKDRRALMEAYALALKRKYSKYEHVIGLAEDIPSEYTDLYGLSKDIVHIDNIEWTPSIIDHIKQMREKFGVLKRGPKKYYKSTVSLYPVNLDESYQVSYLSRKDRRRLNKERSKHSK